MRQVVSGSQHKYDSQREIDINAGFEQWESVKPEFKDTLYDTTHRDSMSFGGQIHYTNDSGRNDIDTAKVSVYDGYANFYVSTREDISKPASNDKKWMNLFVDADQNSDTGWNGYDYIVNRSRKDGKASVEKYTGTGFEWEKVGDAPYRTEGNQMQLSIPLNLFGVIELERFDFKWADNSVGENDIMKFMDMGDAAPNNRFNFRYAVDRETNKTVKEGVWEYKAADAQVTGGNENWDSAYCEVKDWNENTRVDFFVQSDYTSMVTLRIARSSMEGGNTEIYVNDELVRELEVQPTGGADKFKDILIGNIELLEGENVISVRSGSGIALYRISVSEPQPETQVVAARFIGADTVQDLAALDGRLGFSATIQKNKSVTDNEELYMVLAAYQDGTLVTYSENEVRLENGLNQVNAKELTVSPGEVNSAKAMLWQSDRITPMFSSFVLS